MGNQIEYDKEADVLYVRLNPGETVARTVELDDRLIDYSKDGTVIGLEVMDASEGNPVCFIGEEAPH